jgi:hypothetical protein
LFYIVFHFHDKDHLQLAVEWSFWWLAAGLILG